MRKRGGNIIERNPLFLVLRHESVERGASLVLLLVELIDNHADEEVEGEEASEDDEEDKVHVHVDAVLSVGLLVQVNHVNRIVHDVNPPLENNDLQQVSRFQMCAP